MKVQIEKSRLERLERIADKMAALDAGGVDNWEWYSESLKGYNRENEIREKKDSLIHDLECAFGECSYEPSESGAGIAFNEGIFDAVLVVLNDHNVTFSDLDEEGE